MDYDILVSDILNNKEFNKLDEIIHHGTTRLKHSKRVSYYSYKVAKLLNLDYIACARAGLLHDFFLTNRSYKLRVRFKFIFIHPKYSVKNSLKYYDLNDKEINIIESHMFPAYYVLPKYLESWLVSIIDKIVATYEFMVAFKEMTRCAIKFALLLFITKL
jgi:uncharacterized protein